MKLDVDAFRHQVTIADGGWSTQLQMRGVPATVAAETANLTHPQLVTALAVDYADAGARFVTTNTFSAHRIGLERHGLQDQLAEINEAGARLVQDAVGDRAIVIGSIGPSGKMLAVREIDEARIAELVGEQARALAAGGADAIVLETYSELAEILAAVGAAKEASGLPVICSMSFDSGPQRTRTMMGAQANECAAALDDAGADVIGCNCGAGIEHALPVVVALRAATDRPLWVKPNAGVPELEDGKPVWKQTPGEFAEYAKPLIEAGANVIGGCCGSGPEHIRKLAAVISRSRR